MLSAFTGRNRSKESMRNRNIEEYTGEFMNDRLKILNRIFPLQVTKKIYIWIVLLFIVPIIFLLTVNSVNYIGLVNEERAKELYMITYQLNQMLPGSFDDILRQHGALNKSTSQKVLILNSVLQPIVVRLHTLYPEFGIGYYSFQLNSTLAAEPNFNLSMLKPLPPNHPYLKIYQTERPVFSSLNKSFLGQGQSILILSCPIYVDNKVVGYDWASITMDDIYTSVLIRMAMTFGITIIILAIIIYLTWHIFRKFRRDLENMAQAIREDNDHLPQGVLPELNPLLDIIRGRTKDLVAANISLQQLNDRFMKVFHSSPTMMSIIRLSDRTYVDVNKSWLAYHGYLKEEVVGQLATELDCYDPGEVSTLKNDLLSGKTLVNQEMKIRAGSGDMRETLVSTEMISLDDEPCILVTTNDISGRRRLEKEMARLDRLNLVGEMAASLGHEIRNPLTTVRGFLQLLSTRIKKSGDKSEEFFEIMIEELDRANSIISEFLSLAKNKSVDLRLLDLKDIVHALYPLVQADALAFNKCIQTDLGDAPKVFLDEGEIRQLILNLVRNALEATPSGGNVLIRIFTDGGHVVLAIQDQGSGINPEIMDKLGTPFITTKEQGVGLGLAVCYSIAARHDATITVETGSTGTAVCVRFKAAGWGGPK